MKTTLKTLAVVATALTAALPAMAQDTGNATLPGEAACNAVRERVQLALGQADRALQAENHDEVAKWSAIAASYATVYDAFCGAE